MAGGVTGMTLGTPTGAYGPLTLGLRGRHQVRNALVALGADGSPKAAASRAAAWSPWRTYALHHLWATL